MTKQPPPKILLIENDPQFTYLMQRYAEKSECQLISTERDEDGLFLARKELPALIILDMMLPGMSSDRVFKALRADPVTRHIPVVIYSSLETTLFGWEEEADVRLVKPVRYSDFLAALITVGIIPHDSFEAGGCA